MHVRLEASDVVLRRKLKVFVLLAPHLARGRDNSAWVCESPVGSSFMSPVKALTSRLDLIPILCAARLAIPARVTDGATSWTTFKWIGNSGRRNAEMSR